MKKVAKRIVKKIISKSAGKLGYQKYYNYLFSIALDGMNIGKGAGIKESGELNVLDFIKKQSENTVVIFDVGANIGTYTQCLLEYFNNIEIHSFEPSKNTFSKLQENITSSKVKLNNVAISDKTGELKLYKDSSMSSMASTYKRNLVHYNVKMDIEEQIFSITLDEYSLKNNVGQIDLLKLDIEGNELNALKGANNLISAGKIKAIQFEFGGCNIDSKVFFRDFWHMLGDYKIYRILKNGLYQITSYDEKLECFLCTNYLAIHK